MILMLGVHSKEEKNEKWEGTEWKAHNVFLLFHRHLKL